MAQIAELEVQVEIKSSSERFYEIFRSKQHLIPKICPNLVKDVKMIKGDWESVDSIKQWTYVAGNSHNIKETLEAIDEENKRLTFKLFDGDVAKYYKNMKSIVQVTGKGQGGCSVKWTLQYEKQNENIPNPTQYLDLLPVLTRNVDAHLTKNA